MGRVLSFEKIIADADQVTCWEGHTGNAGKRGVAGSAVVGDPEHAEKQHAREPGDLASVAAPTGGGNGPGKREPRSGPASR